MGEPGFTADAALQVSQALLSWMAAIFLGLACLAWLTALVFVWRECFRSPSRQSTGPGGPPEPTWADLDRALNTIELQDDG